MFFHDELLLVEDLEGVELLIGFVLHEIDMPEGTIA